MRHPAPWILLLILALAAALRFANLDYGLPFLLHEDEPVYLRHALAFGFGDFDPQYFKKPGFFLYFYFAFYYLAYLLGDFANWQAFVDAFYRDPSAVTILGRTISAVLSVVSVGLVYLLGKNTVNRTVGLAAAFLLAVDLTHIRFSPIVISDIPSLLCVLLTAWFSLDVYRKHRVRDFLLTGLAAGLTMAFKYNVFVLAFPLAAHFLYWWERRGEAVKPPLLLCLKLWGMVLLSGLVFVTLCPYSVLNLQGFIEDINFERRHMLLRHSGQSASIHLFGSADDIFGNILPRAMDWPLYILCLLGIAGVLWNTAIKRRPGWHPQLMLLSFPLLFLLITANFKVINAKYLLPTYPFLYLLGLTALWRLLGPLSRTRRRVLFILLTLAVAWPMATDSVERVVKYQRPSTRVQAYRWLRERYEEGLTVLADPESIPMGDPALRRGVIIGRWSTEKGRFLPVGIVSAQKPAGVSDALHRLRPHVAVIRLKTRKNDAGEKILPFPDAYYDSLAAHFKLKAIMAPYKSAPNLPALRAADDFLNLYHRIETGDPEEFRPGPILLLLERKD